VLGPDVILARHAGDEFLVFFTAPSFARGRARGPDCGEVDRALLEGTTAGTITASGGWATADAGERRPLGELISEADRAMYQHKHVESQAAAI
jgi:GGDEF domain-containing protein